MEPALALVIVMVVLAALLATETPIAWSLALSGLIGITLIDEWHIAAQTIGDRPLREVASFTLVVVPMYILLGNAAIEARIASHVFQIASKVAGTRRWALGVATVGACAGFAAVSGSSVATAATMARMGIPEMKAHGYSASWAAGIVAAAGTLGALIPPSIILVLYGVITEESIGRLLLAGFIPGLISATIYILYIIFRIGPHIDVESSVANPGTAAAVGDGSGRRFAGLPLRGAFRALIIFATVLLGVYTGTFTVSESGAMAAVVAVGFVVIEHRRDGVRAIWASVKSTLKDTTSTTSMVLTLLVGSATFSYFLVSSGLPGEITQWVGDLDAPALLIIAVLLLMMIPLGMVLEPLSILIIMMPIAHPIVVGLGMDGVWFGIVVIKMIELSLITPPVGLNVFVVAGASDGSASLEDTFRGVLPFAALDLVTVMLLVAFPEIVTFLPDMVLG